MKQAILTALGIAFIGLLVFVPILFWLRATAAPTVNEIFGKPVEQTFQAKAIRSVDGDTLEILLDDNTTPNCRLESIDAPETGSTNIPGQPFSSNATEALKALCVGKTVTVHQTDVDRFGRPLVFVVADGVNVNAELIRQGFGWHYKEYSDDAKLAAPELEAREAKRGLWADAEPILPSDWRKQQREKRKVAK